MKTNTATQNLNNQHFAQITLVVFKRRDTSWSIVVVLIVDINNLRNKIFIKIGKILQHIFLKK